jgi:hypothetical protein
MQGTFASMLQAALALPGNEKYSCTVMLLYGRLVLRLCNLHVTSCLLLFV